MENIETLLAAVAQTQGFDFDEPVSSASPELGLRNSAPSRGEIKTSQLGGDVRASVVVNPAIDGGEKKKRGRPARGQLGARIPVPKRKKEVDEDEDVCFICFDGGSLVLCDRKGCPKAYHPACIKRDEAFFQSKAKWTCGWHICSVCRKASHYLCYTCTFSLCKGCTKDSDYLCVRGNKGFCSTCMKTIMLIENKDQANNDSVQVDFDDKTSWEYLFKVYWVYVKEKLSLTLTELTHAKKPWKGVTAVPCKPQISNVHHSAADGKVSISCSSPMDLEQNKLHEEISFPQNDRLRPSASVTNNLVETLNDVKGENALCFNREAENPCVGRVITEVNIDKGIDEPGIKEAADKPASEHEGDNSSIVKDTDRPCVCRNRDEAKDQHPDKLGSDIGTEWASEDLLEFVAHMKNGDTSALSQFDVQTLLLDYIKKNNLRDPRRKSQIVCDLRLSNLFGKPRVGHIEMLKLLEYHFVVKDSQKNSFIPAGFVGFAASDLEVDGKKYGSSMPINSRKRKSRKKSEERAPQDNLNEYAAIDFHNINLIYLRRKLMENFIEDKENFIDKVVGSIVRIRISSNDQKPDIYRLVQVVGTSKGPESYKIGDKTADIMLEVLNLDKKEVVSIDTLSNQEFTEDECRRLRQSIRCGLMKQFSVGEIQKKAMELQPVRVNDWLEAETERLNHLRDRASEKGRKKELRECIQKLQLLKSPEERQRRVSEVPYIHSDPKMNPNYESEEETRSGDNSKEDENLRPSHSGFTQTERKTISSNKKGKEDSSTRVQNRVVEKIDVSGSRSLRKQKTQFNATKSAPNCGIDQAAQRSGLETSTATASVGNSSPANSIETEKLWHYRDPNAKIQGPFLMMQLRKWNTTGLFPPDMRIWTNHEQYDSLLLTDALNGHFHGAAKLPDKHTSAKEHREVGVRDGVNETGKDGKQIDTASCNRVNDLSDCNTGFLKTDKSSFKLPDKRTSAKQHKEVGGREGVNEAGKDGKRTETASCNHVTDFSDGDTVKTEKSSSPTRPQCLDWVREGVNEAGKDGKRTETASCNRLSDFSDGNTVKADKSSSPARPQCLDLLKDKNSGATDVQACNVLPSSNLELNSVAPSDRGKESGAFNHCSQKDENDSSAPTENQMTSGDELQNQSNNHVQTLLSSEEKLRSLTIELFSNGMESESALASIPESTVAAVIEDIGVLNLPSPTPETCDKHMGVQINENQQSISSDVPVQTSGMLELLSPTSRSNDEGQNSQATETNQSQLTDFPVANPGPSCSNSSTLIVSTQIPEVADEWCGYSPTPAKPTVQEWDFPLGPPEVTSENVATSTLSNDQLPHASNLPNWMFMDGPIEFDALGEESVSDLLAEVDAMESQGNFPSPTSAMKFAKELIEDCKDDCFSSIEFNPIPHPGKTDAMSSTGDNQSTSQASMPYKSMGATPIDTFDSFKRSDVHSSTSSVGETNASGYSGESGSEFHPPAPNNTNQEMVRMAQAPASGMGLESADPGWGTVQGNINLVTVQGNVNLVLGGPGQGMPNLGWGNNPGTGWVNPNLNCRYGGERYPSPREWGYQGGEAGFGRGRAPWGRQPYGGGGGGGGGYLRPPPKGQRVCKFYESGRCRKGAFCDYLHP